MKDLKEILNQPTIYLHTWDEKADIENDFQIKLNDDIHILFASYGLDNYSGDAFVLFEQNQALYEVNGSHCSCYGLEEQWSPEPVLLEEMKNRLLNGDFGTNDYADNQFKDELCLFLGV
jgi:hypothetical protein